MLTCQKEKFNLPEDISYLNCAYMAPLLEKVKQAGYQGIAAKESPFQIVVSDFFEPAEEVKKLYARLINASDSNRIAIIPSVSYGMANVAKNVNISSENNIVLVEEQFPSNYYAWKRLADESGASIKIVPAAKNDENRGECWNQQILEAIDSQTALAAVPNVHWADGTKFDLKSIRQRTSEVGALLIIDGTQSVGALPFDLAEIQPDALICAGYKWLLGPYAFGLAYYGDYFDGGRPIEETWINRDKSEHFQGLVKYQNDYKPKAFRYNVGEFSNFILLPMMKAALEQLQEWQVGKIQAYCKRMTAPFLRQFEEMGCWIEKENFRGNHLFGVRLNDHFDLEKLKIEFEKKRVFVSLRGSAIRIAPHLYNDEKDFEKLLSCFTNARTKVLV